MQISREMSKEQLTILLEEFYGYFATGYEFEEFLKFYLSKIGLDEVVVTQRSRDGGIDLTAVRKGVGEFSDVDITRYFIQAKCNSLSNTVGGPTVIQVKGKIPFGHKGMLITTSTFTKSAIEESTNDPSKPVVLIDGYSLVSSCIDNQIGFIYKPIFSATELNKFVHKNNETSHSSEEDNYVEKEITTNDIRARIISIPSKIMTEIDDRIKKAKVVINTDNLFEVAINRPRNYLGSVTGILKGYGLVTDDGVITPKRAKWGYDKDNNVIHLIINKE